MDQSFSEVLLRYKLVSIIRSELSVLEELKKTLPVLELAGLKLVEVTLNTPKALETISWSVSNKSGNLKFGAGTVTTVDEAKSAIDAGAEFLICPTLSLPVIELGIKHGVSVLPGCMTPTEVFTAHSAGAEFVKLFPVSALGPSYIRDLLGPLSNAKVVAVGGVGLNNLKDYLVAGAVGIGIGSSMLSAKLLREGNEAQIRNSVEQFVRVVDAGL